MNRISCCTASIMVVLLLPVMSSRVGACDCDPGHSPTPYRGMDGGPCMGQGGLSVIETRWYSVDPPCIDTTCSRCCRSDLAAFWACLFYYANDCTTILYSCTSICCGENLEGGDIVLDWVEPENCPGLGVWVMRCPI